MEVEYLFDGRTLCFYFLGEMTPELDVVTAELAEVYEAEAQLRPLRRNSHRRLRPQLRNRRRVWLPKLRNRLRGGGRLRHADAWGAGERERGNYQPGRY